MLGRKSGTGAGLAARLALVVALATAVLASPGHGPVEAADHRPNILLITADDMAESDLRWMPATRRLLKRDGVTVSDFISNHPLCCPARAEILTGEYGQNNGVQSNQGVHGGYPALRQPLNNVGAWLQGAGYNTAFVGKHLNLWEGQAQHDPGWTVFDPIVRGIYQPYGMTMYNDGSPQVVRDVHTSDVVGNRTVAYIRRFAAEQKPFFIWASQVAPHAMTVDGVWGPPVPATRHRTLYPDARPPSMSSAAFNEADVSDKPGSVRKKALVRAKAMIAQHRARIRSLRSVDEQVAAAVRALEETGELRRTYVFFTSDNGFLLGEHRLFGKNVPYEPALQVPLLVRGPRLPAGTVRRATYGMVDLAPTFVQLAGARAGRRLDGRSMMRTLTTGARGYRSYLVQGGNEVDGRWWWRGVRTRRYVYIRYATGFQELYDRRRDPDQVRNVARREAYRAVRRDLAARLTELRDCAGRACRTG